MDILRTKNDKSQVVLIRVSHKVIFADNNVKFSLTNQMSLNLYIPGDCFKCLLDIVPIKNEKSQVVLILVSHKDISDDKSSDKTNKDDSDSNGSPSPTESDGE